MSMIFVALLVGGFFGVIGSFFAWSTDGFVGRLLISVCIAVAILGYCTEPSWVPFSLLAALTLVTGWLAAEYLHISMEDGLFEECAVGTALKVLVVPPLVLCLGWLGIKVLTNILDLIEVSVKVSITAHPALKQWLMLMVFAVWGSFIGAYPNIFLYVRSQTMRRRSGR